MRLLVATLVLISIPAFASSVSAGIIKITTETDITADGTTNWQSLGGNSTLIGQPILNHAINGIAGLTADVSKNSGTQFQRLDQGNGWNGNFADGEALLDTIGSSNGPIRIEFSEGIEGAGAQIQSFAAVYPEDFTVTLEVFDTSNTSLGTFTFDGVSNGNGDDSAIFFGVKNDMGNTIGAVEFDLVGGGRFAFNDFRVQQSDSSTSPVPEPAGNALWALLLLATAVFVRRFPRRRMQPA